MIASYKAKLYVRLNFFFKNCYNSDKQVTILSKEKQEVFITQKREDFVRPKCRMAVSELKLPVFGVASGFNEVGFFVLLAPGV